MRRFSPSLAGQLLLWATFLSRGAAIKAREATRLRAAASSQTRFGATRRQEPLLRATAWESAGFSDANANEGIPHPNLPDIHWPWEHGGRGGPQSRTSLPPTVYTSLPPVASQPRASLPPSGIVSGTAPSVSHAPSMSLTTISPTYAPRAALAVTTTIPPMLYGPQSNFSSGPQVAAANNGLKPQANDTVPDSYYDLVDQRIAEHLVAQGDSLLLDDKKESGWKQVLELSVPTGSNAADQTAQEINDGGLQAQTVSELAQPVASLLRLRGHAEKTAQAPTGSSGQVVTLATPMPGDYTGFTEETNAEGQRVGVLSYDMKLGAKIMTRLVDRNTPPPPADQLFVSSQMVAQCPLVFFGSDLFIGAPQCNNKMGVWEDPASHRAVVRWRTNSGGVHIGVDSVLTGNGSATFANLNAQMSLLGMSFTLSNCLDIPRYTIEEQVQKFDSMSNVVSSGTPGQSSTSGEAFFYKYIIRAPNGSAVAESTLYRSNQSSISFTMLNNEVSSGAVVATASREGTWTGAQWRECSGIRRGWNINFGLAPQNIDMVATVMDLRVAATAAVTLMAYREETIGAMSGHSATGRTSLIKNLLTAALLWLLVIVLIVLLYLLLRRKRLDQKMKRALFKFQAALFPQRPAMQRPVIMYPTY